MRAWWLTAAAVLLVASCSKGVSPEIVDNDEVKAVSFSIAPFNICNEGARTKTSIQTDNGEFYWAVKDTVGIYPDSGAQVYFVVEPGENAKVAKFNGGGWGFVETSTYYSYYPFIGNFYLDKRHIPVVYSGQKQTGTSTLTLNHIGNYDYMWALGNLSSDSDGKKLSFNYDHLNCIVHVDVTLPAGTYTKLAITAPSYLFTLRGHYDLTAATPSIIADEYTTQMQIALEDVILSKQTTFSVYMMLAPVDLNGKEITVSVLNGNKQELQCKKTPSRTYEAQKMYGLTCASWTEVPQSMGLIIEDWGEGGSYSGDAD